eukprot:m.818624 g.818624  ORF g.818624 m.818624 type:complete len:220 (-) comp23394_c0_seq189:5246-5905(-)
MPSVSGAVRTRLRGRHVAMSSIVPLRQQQPCSLHCVDADSAIQRRHVSPVGCRGVAPAPGHAQAQTPARNALCGMHAQHTQQARTGCVANQAVLQSIHRACTDDVSSGSGCLIHMVWEAQATTGDVELECRLQYISAQGFAAFLAHLWSIDMQVGPDRRCASRAIQLERFLMAHPERDTLSPSGGWSSAALSAFSLTQTRSMNGEGKQQHCCGLAPPQR